MLHVEGMGVLGSTLAHALDEAGVPFTWNDTDSPWNAWQASTGSVYPSGDPNELADLKRWKRWAMAWAATYTETVPFWYLSKSHPHGGKYKHDREVFPLRRSPVSAVAVNVQAMVEGTRKQFASQRIDSSPETQKVIAHGYDQRTLSHVFWGWTVPVTLITDARLGQRPLLYLRQGRYGMAYAIPRARTSEYYSGSSIIAQASAKELSVMPKFDRWCSDVLDRTKGLVSITGVGKPIQAWRPAPGRPYEQHKHFATKFGDDVVATPMWHNGVRRSPSFVAEVFRLLGLDLKA
jgi:hypothetical protein